MKVLAVAVLAALAGSSAWAAPPLRLGPGEYRWIPFTVKRIPTGVDCRFRVIEGGATVRMEIMSAAQFRRFNRGRAYEALETAPAGHQGEIRRLVDEPGEFAVVVANNDRAPMAVVELEVSTDLNPSPDSMARVLPPGRRLAVILISFAIFFGLVTWTGFRLLRATRTGQS